MVMMIHIVRMCQFVNGYWNSLDLVPSLPCSKLSSIFRMMAVALLLIAMGFLKATPCDIFRLISRVSTSESNEVDDHSLFGSVVPRSVRAFDRNL